MFFPAIGVYAAIRREKGEPFSFPGGPSFVWEVADADLVADVMVWAAESPQAANKAFNITNGDVFEWRNLWPALAETLGVETEPDMPTSGNGLPRGKTRTSGTGSSRSTGFVPETYESWLATGTNTRTSRSPMALRQDPEPS